MLRRQFIRTLTATGTSLAVAGCAGDTGGESADAAAETGSPTDVSTTGATTTVGGSRGIYVQTFREEMSMQGTTEKGDYEFALMFAVPHDFWTVTGDSLSLTEATDDDSLHLMVSVWDTETRTVLPETGLSVEITRDGDLVSEEVIYPMLSQPMSFHYGGNFSLAGDGSYTVSVSVGGMRIRRTGSFAGRFAEPATVDLPLAFTEESRDEVRSRPIDEGGDPGALRPMEMMTPQATLPDRPDLPGTVRGSGLTDGARLVVTTLADPPTGVDGDGTYLAVSARTRYNGYVLPAMALSATVERAGDTVLETPLERTLDPDLGYHYGTTVDTVESGDELTLSVDTIPQVARHEGYETAFRRMGDTTVTL